jgi:small subunit ribosomal protein S6
MVIIVPDITDEETTTALERVKTYIGDIDGELKEILTDSPWGRRRLAYTIRFNSVDYRDGYYAVIHFSAGPDRLGDLERELKLDTKVVRYLLVHDDPKAGVREPNNPDRTPETQAVVEAPVVEVAAAEAAPAETEAAPVVEEAVVEVAAVEETAPATTEDAPAETSEEE